MLVKCFSVDVLVHLCGIVLIRCAFDFAQCFEHCFVQLAYYS